MKGRANYLCRQKLYDAEAMSRFSPDLEEIVRFQADREWEKETETGDRSELRASPRTAHWWKARCAQRACTGQKCKQFERCFITEMHRRAAESDIIIVNHHLFFADLAVRGQPFGAILPDYCGRDLR